MQDIRYRYYVNMVDGFYDTYRSWSKGDEPLFPDLLINFGDEDRLYKFDTVTDGNWKCTKEYPFEVDIESNPPKAYFVATSDSEETMNLTYIKKAVE